MVTYDFRERTVVVTGGARGIGRSHALAFARAGADVAVFDVRSEEAAAVVEQIEETGNTGLAVPCDVTDEAAVEAAVERVLDDLGRIDVLVNNAGVDRMGRLTELDEQTWDLVHDVNLKGSWLVAKHVGQHMIDRDGEGRIVNTSSFFGHTTIPGLGAYSASKFGIRALTRTLSLELAPHDVTVNVVSPIGVKTAAVTERPADSENFLVDGTTHTGRYNELDPGERIQPEDVTEVVLWLASDAARFVTGTSIPIDAGGLSA
jgi:NAD(P)-dependent dehydrogenase (short-subunit alcohol dehydrogenase family)